MTKEQRKLLDQILYAFYQSGDSCVELAEKFEEDVTVEIDSKLAHAFDKLLEGATDLNVRLEELEEELGTDYNFNKG